MADIPWHPARRTALGHRALPSTASPASQAPAQRRVPFGSAASTALRPVALGLQQLWGVQKVLPAHVPGVLVQQDHPPRRHWLLLAMAVPGPPVDEHGLGGRAARDQRPGLARLAPHLMATVLAGQAPHEVLAQGPRVPLWQRAWCLPRPAQRVTGTAQVTKFLTDASDGVLDLALGALFDPLIPGAEDPAGDCPHNLAAWAFGFKGLACPLTHAAQRLFGHGALPPED